MNANKLINMIAELDMEANENLIDKIICRAMDMGVNINNIEEISDIPGIDADYDIAMEGYC